MCEIRVSNPYAIANKGLDARRLLTISTAFNFVTAADTHGGNSGSPTLNTKDEIIGILFNGNFEGLPSRHLDADDRARSVHAASQGIIEALGKLYHSKPLAKELGQWSGHSARALRPVRHARSSDSGRRPETGPELQASMRFLEAEVFVDLSFGAFVEPKAGCWAWNAAKALIGRTDVCTRSIAKPLAASGIQSNPSRIFGLGGCRHICTWDIAFDYLNLPVEIELLRWRTVLQAHPFGLPDETEFWRRRLRHFRPAHSQVLQRFPLL